MASEFWWRSWHGAPMDHKWAVIAARAGVKVGVVSAIAWALLDYASQHKERGTVYDFDVETYAVYSGFSEEEVRAVIQAMQDKDIIVDGRFANWEKRQPKSEKEIQRATEYRQRQANVTESYAVLQNVTENCTDTDTDTDTDTEAESSTPPPPPARPEIFTVYEKEIGMLTPSVTDKLLAAENEYPPGWVGDALQEASSHNKRNWAYAAAILKRWKAEGRGAGTKPPPGGKPLTLQQLGYSEA